MRPFLTLTLTLLLLSGGLLLPSAGRAAAGSLSGFADLDYAGYAAEEDGTEEVEASHFRQQYSILYQKSGRILRGRGGGYSLALGAEYNYLAADLNEESIDLDSVKILYNGDLLLAPAALPFRLHAYSRDLRRSQMLADAHPALSRGQEFGNLDLSAGGKILPSRIYTDLQNGQHIETGATLLVGIRNGSYMGSYRDLLSQLPRLLMDYRQLYVRDLSGRIPRHYMSRDLAFVSLNKKDNWFHYRFSDYRDFNDSGEHYVEKTYMLGTVDHALQRQWINLTNWIRISGDGSFTTSRRPRVLAGGLTMLQTDTYNINMFAKATRTNYEAATFVNMFRETESSGYWQREVEFPLYAHGELGRKTAWRFRLVGFRQQEPGAVGVSADDDVFASTEIETFRTGPYILKPSLEAEVRSGDRGEGLGGRVNVEFFSNRLYQRRADLFLAYSLGYASVTADDGDDFDYLEQMLHGRAEYQVSPQIRIGVDDKVVYGQGGFGGNPLTRLSFQARRKLSFNASDEPLVADGRVYSNSLSLFLENTRGRLRNRLEVQNEIFSLDGESEGQLSLRHRLDYDPSHLRLAIKNLAVSGDNLGGEGFSGGRIVQLLRPELVGADLLLKHATGLAYLPSRNWEADIEAGYSWVDADSGGGSEISLHQKLKYNLDTANGIVRRLAQFRQEFAYERVDYSGLTGDGYRLILGGDYFPTHILQYGAEVQYVFVSPQDVGQIAFRTYAGLHFQKLAVDFDYAYGTRSSGETVAARREHRWQMQIKKTF